MPNNKDFNLMKHEIHLIKDGFIVLASFIKPKFYNLGLTIA